MTDRDRGNDARGGKRLQPSEGDAEMLALRLAKDTDISEDEARELIKLIGTDWTSLLREARFLKGRH